MKLSLLAAAVLAAPAAAQQADLPEWMIHEDSWRLETEALQNPQYSWSTLSANTYNRSRPGGNWVGNKFYLIGGELLSSAWGISRAEEVEVFDATTLSWSSASALMPIPVSNIMGSTAVVGTKIYVFGGYDSASSYVDAIQIYDTATDSWTVSNTLLPNGGRLGMLATSVGSGLIFVCGGGDSAGISVDETYLFDTNTESFMPPLASMPTPRRYVTGDFDAGRVVAAAGYGTENVVEVYDFNVGGWVSMQGTTLPRGGCGVAVVGPLAVFVGGGWSNYGSDCEVLNLATNTYRPTVAAALGSMAIGRRTFAYGLLDLGSRKAFISVDGYNGSFLSTVEALY